MLQEGIIEPIEESEWISPIVIQENKIGEIRLCLDLKNLNDSCLTNPFPTPFTYEVLERIGGEEVYLFTYRSFRIPSN